MFLRCNEVKFILSSHTHTLIHYYFLFPAMHSPLFFSSVIWHQEQPHREQLSCVNASLIISKLNFKLNDINIFRSIFSVFLKNCILSLLNNSHKLKYTPNSTTFFNLKTSYILLPFSIIPGSSWVLLQALRERKNTFACEIFSYMLHIWESNKMSLIPLKIITLVNSRLKTSDYRMIFLKNI